MDPDNIEAGEDTISPMCEDINIVQCFESDKDHLGYDRGTRPCMFEWFVANLTT